MNKLTPLFFVLLFMGIPQANAFLGLSTVLKKAPIFAPILKSAQGLSNDEIVKLAKLSDEFDGPKKVGSYLGNLNLPHNVLEDTFMRIAIYQGKVSRKNAEEMYIRLSGTPGFSTTIRKIIGNSSSKTVGHLNELKIADNAAMHGFKVLGIGNKFTDGLKNAPTDIDIVLKKGTKTFAIEAKAYSSTTKFPMDKYRADLDTLVQFKNEHTGDLIPIFSITNKPNDSLYIKMLKREADKRGIELIFGSPLEQIEKIKILAQIL